MVYGRLPPSAGAFTLSEEQLYTRESFGEYLGHLEDGGVLSITRFVFEKRILRLVALARAALEDAGAPEPGRHVFMAAERGLATMLVCRRPFREDELETMRRWCDRLGFEILHDPGRRGNETFARLLSPAEAGAVEASSPFDITPPTDDRPYFYYLLRPGDFWRSLAVPGRHDFEDRAVLLVRNSLLILLALTLALILVPLWRRTGGDGGRPWSAAAFFGCIALGFMAVEIVLLKVMVLYLGHPVYSLTVVLATLLLSAGVGSALSTRLLGGASAARLTMLLAGIAVAVSVFFRLNRTLLEATAAWSLPARVAVAVLLVAPLGLLLGMPMPTGIRLLGRRSGHLVAWAFGVNGAMSVVGTMLVTVLALNYGFSLTWLVAPLAYLAALPAALRLRGEP